MACQRVAVIVPSFNEAGLMEACLKSIRAQKNFDDYILVVVDGHSRDNTVKIARKYADNIIYDKGRGAGAARNLAVRKVKSEIVAFTDADTIVPENWLEQISRNFERNETVAVGGPVAHMTTTFLEAVMAKAMLVLFGFFSVIKKPYLSGNNCAYRRSTFLRAKGFREDLTMLDDFELAMRISKFGKCFFDSGLCVRTSTRRMKTGHISLIIKYVKALYGLLFKNRVEIEYLQDRKLP